MGHKKTEIDPLDLKACNCAQCGVELLSREHMAYAIEHRLQVVRGYALGRPYCALCLSDRPVPNPPARPDDTSPAQDNAVRAMEDGAH